MSIAKIRKIHILAHRSLQTELIRELQRVGAVEISRSAAAVETTEAGKEEKVLEVRVQRIDETLKLLRPHLPPARMREKLYPVRPRYSEQEALEVTANFDLSGFLGDCDARGRQIEELRLSLTRLEEERRLLAPWSALDVPLDTLRPTSRVEIVGGRLPQAQRPTFQEALEEAGGHREEVWKDEKHLYYLVFFLKAAGPAVREVFTAHGFQPLELPPLPVAPGRRLTLIRQERKERAGRLRELREGYRELAARRDELAVLRDTFSSRLDRCRAERMMAVTGKTVSIEGWIPARILPQVREDLSRRFRLLSIRDYAPDPLDRVPVVLDNHRVVRPFGLVVSLYGLPRYGSLDPSPVLAVFYALFFGLCLTDAGYGILLSSATGAVLYFSPQPLPEGRRRFFQMFFLCGLATIVLGAMAGGWFGVTVSWRIFDPLTDLMTFFIVALLLGTIHLFAGLTLRIVRLVREKDFFGALVDEGLWISLIIPLLGLGAVEAGAVPAGYRTMFSVWSLASALGIVFFQGRGEEGAGRVKWAHRVLWGGITLGLAFWLLGMARPWSGAAVLLCLTAEIVLVRGAITTVLGRVGLGLYSLYGVSGYLSDILSYSRLVALGLGTGIVAMVVNLMSKVSLGMPVIGFLMAGVILVVGHLFNLLINLLGAFVHSCRLQYVEFFTKFYEPGGKAFSPFRMVTKYITIEDKPFNQL